MTTATAVPPSPRPGPATAVALQRGERAVATAPVIMARMVASARLSLQGREATCSALAEREALALAASSLRQWESKLCQAFGVALAQALADWAKDAADAENAPGAALQGVASDPADGLQFKQLEQMDATQVLDRVARVGVRRLVLQGARLDSAQLQPDPYLAALHTVVQGTQVPHNLQLQWLHAMALPLGQVLRELVLAHPAPQPAPQAGTDPEPSEPPPQPPVPPDLLASSGAAQAEPDPADSPADSPAEAAGLASSLLTLDRLRHLLAGNLVSPLDAGPATPLAQVFAASPEAELPDPTPPPTDYHATVPAALEALTEMNQVEQVVQRLERRRQSAPPTDVRGLEAQRQALRRSARDVAQGLSLEVVTLMLDNLVQDARLLPPVRAVLRDLEPALLRLVLVDRRFFLDAQHPARRLLQTITDYGLAFETDASPGFADFMEGLRAAVLPLGGQVIADASPFALACDSLQRDWTRSTQDQQIDRDAAMTVLRHAEARNLLAEAVSRQIASLPETTQVPAVVTEFLCGPWAQVMAQVRIRHGDDAPIAEKYAALIPALLWSAHPQRAPENPSKLMRLLPQLLPALREGLASILYPEERTQVFLDALLGIHQAAFRAASSNGLASNLARPRMAAAEAPKGLDALGPWMAPSEAAASNFMDLDDTQPPAFASPAGSAAGYDTVPPPEPDVPLGAWVELWSQGQWVRTQLTWASPHGTLFLFTGALGTTQSMSRQVRDQLLRSGKLRVVAAQPMLDGAFNAVAQVALRNSIDTLF